MDLSLWFQLLHRWLKRHTAVERELNGGRTRAERTELELRKFEARAWYLSPPY